MGCGGENAEGGELLEGRERFMTGGVEDAWPPPLSFFGEILRGLTTVVEGESFAVVDALDGADSDRDGMMSGVGSNDPGGSDLVLDKGDWSAVRRCCEESLRACGEFGELSPFSWLLEVETTGYELPRSLSRPRTGSCAREGCNVGVCERRSVETARFRGVTSDKGEIISEDDRLLRKQRGVPDVLGESSD